MIQPLRTIHRNAFFCLAVLLPVLLVAGIVKRHEPLAARPSEGTLPNGQVLTEQAVVFDGHKVAVDLYETNRNPVRVEFAESQPLVVPDVLVYWSEASSATALPADAWLLGAFTPGTTYTVPLGGQARGYLILYSAARHTPLGVFSYEGAP